MRLPEILSEEEQVEWLVDFFAKYKFWMLTTVLVAVLGPSSWWGYTEYIENIQEETFDALDTWYDKVELYKEAEVEGSSEDGSDVAEILSGIEADGAEFFTNEELTVSIRIQVGAVLANLKWKNGARDDALQTLESTLALTENYGVPQSLIDFIRVQYIRMLIALDRLTDAERELATLEETFMGETLVDLRGDLAAELGKFDEARTIWREVYDPDKRSQGSFLGEMMRIKYASWELGQLDPGTFDVVNRVLEVPQTREQKLLKSIRDLASFFDTFEEFQADSQVSQ